jgi:hypothetical protein
MVCHRIVMDRVRCLWIEYGLTLSKLLVCDSGSIFRVLISLIRSR